MLVMLSDFQAIAPKVVVLSDPIAWICLELQAIAKQFDPKLVCFFAICLSFQAITKQFDTEMILHFAICLYFQAISKQFELQVESARRID